MRKFNTNILYKLVKTQSPHLTRWAFANMTQHQFTSVLLFLFEGQHKLKSIPESTRYDFKPIQGTLLTLIEEPNLYTLILKCDNLTWKTTYRGAPSLKGFTKISEIYFKYFLDNLHTY